MPGGTGRQIENKKGIRWDMFISYNRVRITASTPNKFRKLYNQGKNTSHAVAALAYALNGLPKK